MSALSPADLHCKYWHGDVFAAAPETVESLEMPGRKKTEMKGSRRKNVFDRTIPGSTPWEAVWVSWGAGEGLMGQGNFICPSLDFARQSCS